MGNRDGNCSCFFLHLLFLPTLMSTVGVNVVGGRRQNHSHHPKKFQRKHGHTRGAFRQLPKQTCTSTSVPLSRKAPGEAFYVRKLGARMSRQARCSTCVRCRYEGMRLEWLAVRFSEATETLPAAQMLFPSQHVQSVKDVRGIWQRAGA